ncbi:MAG: branched-chain amino acid ABC transporter permease [Limnochordales bacterium]|nr:branched-chain amino acid ABC transporter permease [Limnochordales bacterium]
MFYRECGVRHTNYVSDRAIASIPFERWLLGVLLAAAVLAPLYISDLFLVSYLTPWLLWSAAALGLNLLMGLAGQIHLGYAAIMAVGAYASIHMARAGVPFGLAVVGGGLLAAVIGSLFGLPAMRVRGLYLAMSTLALQFIVDWTLVQVPAISGGAQATLVAPRPSILGLSLVSDEARYYVALALAVATGLFLVNVRRTDLGRTLVALREKDYAAAVIGINVFYYKSLAFAVSSFIGGVSGSLLAFMYYRAVTPEQFGLNVSIMMVAMVIIGGLGSVIGSFFGAGFVLLAPIILERLLRAGAAALSLSIPHSALAHIPLIIYGGLIVLFLLGEPLGLAKVYDNMRNYLRIWPFGYTRK